MQINLIRYIILYEFYIIYCLILCPICIIVRYWRYVFMSCTVYVCMIMHIHQFHHMQILYKLYMSPFMGVAWGGVCRPLCGSAAAASTKSRPQNPAASAQCESRDDPTISELDICFSVSLLWITWLNSHWQPRTCAFFGLLLIKSLCWSMLAPNLLAL